MTLPRRASQPVIAPFDPIAAAADLSRQFAETAAETDRSGETPRANFEALAEAGLLRLTIPTEAGGHGAGLETASKVVEWIGRGEPSTALILAMHLINHATVVRTWPPEIASRLQEESRASVSLLNALRVEPELGTPARGGLPATIGRRTADGWRVSGHKLYSTGIPVLRWLLVWGRTDEAEPRTGIFLVPADAPSITTVPTWNHLGMRATASHDVILEDVAIPFDHALDLRPAAAGGRDPEYWAWATVTVASLYNGVALAARGWLVEFLKNRLPSNLGAPLASLPRIQEAVGEIAALLTVNARLLSSACRDVDSGRIPEIAESGIIKSTVTNNAVAAVEIALKLSGNHGLSRDNPLERHHRDVLCGRIHTPQDDSVRIAAGKHALGLD
jgi:alkylation response protein AidB-like acyl-CoA dehydrogenase